MSSFVNEFVKPATTQLVVGEIAGPFGITARSVPTDVSLVLNATGLQVFIIYKWSILIC